ncbi:hypothetical protein [Micromonospora aurantiaca (nom. illeg.)]|uniref:hypothetical protein n=1 Tax=Micromonospora aurantiaca (nom. illeg.) TaxID=47850 RepID=UPI00340CBE96
MLAQVRVLSDRGPELLGGGAAVDAVEVDFPAAGAGVEPGPHLDVEAVAQLGDTAADHRGPVDRAASEVP